jgi:hypothetical protein
MSATYNLAQMKHLQVCALACGAVLILALCSSGWGMEMRVIGDQVILTGPMSGFEVTQFMSSLTRAVTTVVFHNSGGGDFDAGLNAVQVKPPTVCLTILLRHAANFSHFSDLAKFLIQDAPVSSSAERIALP